MISAQIADLAARRVTADDLSRLGRALHDLDRAEQPLEAQIAADIEFHLAQAQAAHLSSNVHFTPRHRPELLDGATVLECEAEI